MTAPSCRRKRQARLILLEPIARPFVAEVSQATMRRPPRAPLRVQRTRRRVQTPMLLEPALPSIPATFRLRRDPVLQALATRSWTRNISSSRKRYSRSRNRNGKNSSSSRNRNISGWSNRTPVKQQSSRWSSGTSKRRNNCSRGTNNSDNSWSSDSSHRRIGIGPSLRTRAVLRLKMLNCLFNEH